MKLRNWMTVLKNLTDEQGMAALEQVLSQDFEFMPTVGKFKEICLSGLGSRSIEGDAIAAWGLVLQNLNPYDSPIFADCCIAETIRNMGGWKRLCDMTDEEIPFRRNEFLDIYPGLKRRGREYSPVLVGIYGLKGAIGQDYAKFIGFEREKDKSLALLKWERERNNTQRALALLQR